MKHFRVVDQPESKCFVTGFLYLHKHLSPSKYLEQGRADHRPEVAATLSRLDAYKKSKTSSKDLRFCRDVITELATYSPEDVYARSHLVRLGATAGTAFPCLLAICGTNCTFMQVKYNKLEWHCCWYQFEEKSSVTHHILWTRKVLSTLRLSRSPYPLRPGYFCPQSRYLKMAAMVLLMMQPEVAAPLWDWAPCCLKLRWIDQDI